MSLHLEALTLKLAEFTLRMDARLDAPITGISGPSGAGKTTLLEIIAGLRRPEQGRVVLHGRTLTDVAQRLQLPPEARQIGYVPQDLALFPHLSAQANLLYGYQRNEHNATLPAHVCEVLEINSLLTRPLPQLSGGEQQRLALGRALLSSPRLLLLDEPLSSLDDRLRDRMLAYFKAISVEFQVPMLYVTHSRAELTALCDLVLTLDRGQLTGLG